MEYLCIPSHHPAGAAASLDAVLDVPSGAPRAVFVLAHGAAAEGKDHPLLQALAQGIARHGYACLRFDFPFIAQKKASPNSTAVLDSAYLSALHYAEARFPGTALLAAGKSLGAKTAARVTALREKISRNATQAEEGTALPSGLLLLTYPLHPAGRPGCPQDTPVLACSLPMLFIQGTRDPFANAACMRECVQALHCVRRASAAHARHDTARSAQSECAELHFIEGGDHSLRGSERPDVCLQECAGVVAAWAARVLAQSAP
jgi:predicted alpha/beta-hydrolase family hydrolase